MKRFVYKARFFGKATNRGWLEAFLKLGLVVVFGWIIYEQRFAERDLSTLFTQFGQQVREAPIGWLWVALLLMPINWWLESRKWQVFTRTFTRASPGAHLRAVLAGVTFSLFTPNRIGDYLGRMLIHGEKRKGRIVLATLAANMVQLVVILSAGWLGALYFLPRYTQIPWSQWGPLALIGLGGTIGLMLVGTCGPYLLLIVKKIRWIQRFSWVRHSISVGTAYASQQFWQALGWALLRYGVYAGQYYSLLRFTGIDVLPAAAASGIATTFLIQTSVPLPPALGLLARGEIALFVWGIFGANEWRILCASYGLFGINLLLPGLFGLTMILRINFLKPTNHENIFAENRPTHSIPDAIRRADHSGR